MRTVEPSRNTTSPSRCVLRSPVLSDSEDNIVSRFDSVPFLELSYDLQKWATTDRKSNRNCPSETPVIRSIFIRKTITSGAEEMSRASGGAIYIPNTEDEPKLAGICTQIAYELRQQYTLGFYSSDMTGKKCAGLRFPSTNLGEQPD